MLTATLAKEIVIKRLNEIGVLSDIAKTVAEKGVSILAVSAWVEGRDGVIRLTVDDELRAADALRAKNHEVREGTVVMVHVPHKPGMLKHMTELLRDAQIDIHHLYASAASDQTKCVVVFSSSDNQKAMVVLNQGAH
ncbi:MAG: ACT domain-containing protein [Elusimicrobia bacterium]|nr:ACT domain-containing protein [Elusimicrobiota bacterium]